MGKFVQYLEIRFFMMKSKKTRILTEEEAEAKILEIISDSQHKKDKQEPEK